MRDDMLHKLNAEERRVWNTAIAKLIRQGHVPSVVDLDSADGRADGLTWSYLLAFAVDNYCAYREAQRLAAEHGGDELIAMAESARMDARVSLAALLQLKEAQVVLGQVNADGLDVELVRFFEAEP